MPKNHPSPLASVSRPPTAHARISLAAAVLAAAAALVAAEPSQARASPPDTGISKKAGPPRHWHAGIPVSKYSLVNLRNGDLFSTLQLTNWSGRGIPVSMDLYHNSLSTVSGLEKPPVSGINLGKGWSHSYGDQLWFPSSDWVYVVHASGLLTGFNWQTDHWAPDGGVHDTLVQDESCNWILAHKDGSYFKFEAANGRLFEQFDSSGNATKLDYETVGTDVLLADVTDASGRQLTFSYNESGTLASISAPPATGTTNRTWLFTYDSESGWMDTLTDPMQTVTQFVYDTAGRIHQIIDPNGNSSLVTYSNGFVAEVDDPAPFDGQSQVFAYDEDTHSFYHTYTESSGKDWVYEFDAASDNLVSLTDPLSQAVQWTWDDYHNPVAFSNALSNTWQYQWDAAANLTEVINPLGQATRMTYDTHEWHIANP